MTDLLIIMHELLCAILLVSVFFRSVRSCDRVLLSVRFAFFSLGVVACAGIVAPLAWAYVPSVFSIVLLAAFTGVQLVTSHYWSPGVPAQFYKPGCCPYRSPDF